MMVDINEGTPVMMKLPNRPHKLAPIYEGPFVVVRRTQGGTYVLKDETNGLGRCSDVLFAPIEVTISLPPVLVEVQNTIDLKFVQRIIEYSLAVIKEHCASPIIVVFGIHPTKTSIATDLIQNDQIPYAKEYPCKPWAKSFYILDPTTINSHVHEQPLEPLVAVEYFLYQQKRTLLSMDSKERAVETIQLLYSIVKQIFENEVTLEERTIGVLLNVCEQTQKQFYKIKEALEIEDLEELRKRAREYTEDGYTYLESCKAKYRRISLPEPLDLPEEAKKSGSYSGEYNEDLLPALDQPNTKSPDFVFVENFRSNEKRMNWSACFNTGRAKGLFKIL
ncbi:hypothetical protein CU098_004721 [Rhizopus stolonifer]|uniref:Uncharacterized protein n=1 Tax=Rhizopus stolonifer TaxID=4846 RepID=A0A367KQF8_RHIST|nr:hypothetical protein CU098_004721 [Rhizopus stolonifer]